MTVVPTELRAGKSTRRSGYLSLESSDLQDDEIAYLAATVAVPSMHFGLVYPSELSPNGSSSSALGVWQSEGREQIGVGGWSVYWAKTIVARWVERRLWTEDRDERLTAYLAATGRPDSDAPGLLAMVSYPETITLARLLADHNWAAIAAADRPRDRADFDREVGR